MDKAAAQVIANRGKEFIAELASGRREWTSTELASYFLEYKKTKLSEVTIPEHNLGPTDKARAALLARASAALLGTSVELGTFKRNGETLEGYVFSPLSEEKISLPTVVERVVEKRVEVPVEKIVYRDAPGTKSTGDLSPVVVFPDAPATQKPNTHYVPAAWAKRMEAALDAKKHVALAGPPGIGKSTAPEQYFIRKGQPFVVVNGDAGFRRRDMEGSTEIQNGTTFFRVAEFAAAAVNGWGCILNEVNAADPDALLFINGILEVPHVVNIQGKAYPVHPDFKLVVTYNDGLIGTKALPQAFVDRFMPIRLSFPERGFLRKIVAAKTGFNENPMWMDRLLDYAERCNDAHTRGVLRYQISPRRLCDVVFMMTTSMTTDLREAIQWGVIDAVSSTADRQVLTNLIDSPVGAVRTAGVR